MEKEKSLTGGNMTSVWKKGDIVLREQKPWSPVVHRLLKYLEESGFLYSPKYLGVDERGREILSYMPGDCLENYPPVSSALARLEIIKHLAGILRNFHDITGTFPWTENDVWMLSYKGKLEKEVICHNDIAPYNVTFIKDMPAGLIDFDTCCPGPRIWDIAYALYRFVPLSAQVYEPDRGKYRSYERELDGEIRKTSICEFFKAYGMEQPEDLMFQISQRLKSLADFIREEAEKGNVVFEKMLKEGHREFYLNEIQFILDNEKDWA